MIVRSGFSPLPIAFVVVLSAIFAVSADAATVTIAWDPSPDQNVIGYQVYVGASPGSYAETFDVGLATSFTYSPGDESVHYFAVAAYAVGPVVGPLSREVASRTNSPASYWSSLWEIRAEAMQLARKLLEAAAPTISIAVPTSQHSYSTDQSFVE